jgi:type I restriction enzyme S subunit
MDRKELVGEFDTQLDYLKQLRQSILQEAIEGKLTAEWRASTTLSLRKSGKEIKGNPDYDAAALLEVIKKEKAKLIGEGKLKKEKPLPEIEDSEKPFELPEGWVWCRLGEICEISGGKRVANGYKLLKTPTSHIYIRVSDMKDGTIDDSDLHYIDESMYQQIKKYTISKDDLYMTIVGATIGKCGVVPDRFHNMNLTENAAKISLHLVNKIFIYNSLSSNYCQNQFIDKTSKLEYRKWHFIEFLLLYSRFLHLQYSRQLLNVLIIFLLWLMFWRSR